MTEMKAIRYRGGVVTFSIPANWREEYEQDGGGMFYEDGPDSGTLRLNVLTTEAPSDVQEVTAIGALNVSGEPGESREINELANGNAVARYSRPVIENGEQLQIHFWEVANPLPPRGIRLAVFSYTILASQALQPGICREIELLDKCITDAVFHPGQGVSGKYPPRPWWKIW